MNLKFILFLSILFNLNKKFGQESISCDFESDLCGYSTNGFFQRYTGKSPSLTSGPSSDKTEGINGYYGLCNGKLLINLSDRCKLYRNVSIEKETDFKFWYFMYGNQIGTLELILNETQSVWSMSGKQKNEWLLAQVKLPPGDYLLEFSANRSQLGRLSSDIALDDIEIETQPLTTKFFTVSRSTARPVVNISTEFNTLDNLFGWHTDFFDYSWLQTNGNANLNGLYGPGSDWSSLFSTNNYTLNRPNQPRQDCMIPYKISLYPNKLEYYCKKYFFNTRNSICGIQEQSNVSNVNNREIAICNLGYYMMTVSENFNTEIGSFRSRFYSPVFRLTENRDYFCFSFKYNIYTNSTDGFGLVLENYLNPNEYRVLFEKRGPLLVDKWYSESVFIKNVEYDQLVLYFEPLRGKQINEYASISIDSVLLSYDPCEISTTTTTTTTTYSIQTASVSENIIETTITNDINLFSEFVSETHTSSKVSDENTIDIISTSITSSKSTSTTSKIIDESSTFIFPTTMSSTTINTTTTTTTTKTTSISTTTKIIDESSTFIIPIINQTFEQTIDSLVSTQTDQQTSTTTTTTTSTTSTTTIINSTTSKIFDESSSTQVNNQTTEQTSTKSDSSSTTQLNLSKYSETAELISTKNNSNLLESTTFYYNSSETSKNEQTSLFTDLARPSSTIQNLESTKTTIKISTEFSTKQTSISTIDLTFSKSSTTDTKIKSKNRTALYLGIFIPLSLILLFFMFFLFYMFIIKKKLNLINTALNRRNIYQSNQIELNQVNNQVNNQVITI